jgi:hypothetical protein
MGPEAAPGRRFGTILSAALVNFELDTDYGTTFTVIGAEVDGLTVVEPE